MRKARRPRSRTRIRSLPAPEQLSLPFEWKELACAYQSRNPSRWIDRHWQHSPTRLVTRRAKPVRRDIVPASSFLDNIKEKVRQGHPFWLTSPMSDYKFDVIQNGWRGHGTALPSNGKSEEPKLGSGRAHVVRGGCRNVQANPLACDRRRPCLPALRLPWRPHLQDPRAVQMQSVRASIQRHVRDHLRQPQAAALNHSPCHRHLRERR
jgi:hypothetical protein